MLEPETKVNIPRTGEEVPRITVEELHQEMESNANILVVDTRSQASYARGHIRGAVLVPGEKIRAGEWEPTEGKKLILY